MKVQPVRRARVPGYPTKDFLQEHPELLSAIPARWRNHRVVLAALGGTISLALAAEGGRIAPLFAHGNGRGAFGCMTVNPPVFLTEEEGRAIVREEGRRAGLDFQTDGRVEERAQLPVTSTQSWQRGLPGLEKGPPMPEWQTKRLVFDGYDAQHQVAYEIVSRGDFEEWEWKGSGQWSSVSEYDLDGAARRLRTGLEQQRIQAGSPDRGPWVGVFYTPGKSPEFPSTANAAEWEALQKQAKLPAKTAGEAQLRQQVRDFIAWLKAQGVI